MSAQRREGSSSLELLLRLARQQVMVIQVLGLMVAT
jgi:hypothetical protein